MRLANTVRTRFGAVAVLAVAALPLCASIPRELRIAPGRGETEERGSRFDCAHRRDGGDRSVAVQAFALPTNAVCPDGTAETFTYGANGLLLSAARTLRLPTAAADCHCASRLAFSYDAMNRLALSETRVAGQTFTVGYGYALGGLVANVTLTINSSLLTVNYSYDADGRVTNVTD